MNLVEPMLVVVGGWLQAALLDMHPNIVIDQP